MKVHQNITYTFDGKDFKSLDDIKTHVENKLGAIIDRALPSIPSKNKVKLLDELIKNKQTIIDMLSVHYDVYTLDIVDTGNILDY